jgi:hypothetical protein
VGALSIDQRPIAQVGDTTFHLTSLNLSETSLANSLSQQAWSSDGTLAFDLEPAKVIARVDANKTTLSKGLQLTFPTVVGSDVYAVDQTGTDGWARIMRVNADGSQTVYRAVSNHRVATPASDGTTMYWTECYGDPNPAHNQQPNVELWSAPYTSDPSVLATTATKVANLGTNCVWDLQQLAQNGLFFAVSGSNNYVYRKSDGKVLPFSNGPNRTTWYPLFVSQTEYWSIESISFGANGVGFTRLGLDAW